MTTPKPVPTAIDLHMQCVATNTAAGKLEEQYLRQSLKLARVYQVTFRVRVRLRQTLLSANKLGPAGSCARRDCY